MLELLRATDSTAAVVAPVPWFPFTSSWFGRYAAMARAERSAVRHGVSVRYPRHLVIPKIGMSVAPALMARGCAGAVRESISESGPVDVLDAHYFFPDGVAASILAERFGLPFIVTARGSDINLIAKFDAPRRQILAAASKARAVVAVSEALAEEMQRIGIAPEKISVVRNGVDLDFFSPGDREVARQNLGLEQGLFISVGALKEAKGHDIAIRFMTLAKEATLAVIGQGPDEARLRRLARDVGVHDRVMFTGALDPQQLREYYRAADALILMSVREGTPNVVLESIACGTPVIASAVGGIPALVDSELRGQLAEQRSVEGLADAWRRLDQTRPARSDTRNSAERFRWADSIDQLHGIMERAAA